jgi:hypothetical protein
VSYGLGLLTGSDVKSCGVSFRRSRFSRQPIQRKPLWPTSSSGSMGFIPAATHTSSWTMYHSQPPTRGRPASVLGVVSMPQSLQSGINAEPSTHACDLCGLPHPTARGWDALLVQQCRDFSKRVSAAVARRLDHQRNVASPIARASAARFVTGLSYGTSHHAATRVTSRRAPSLPAARHLVRVEPVF